MYFHKSEHLMNDWEIGGTQNKWVCPSDRHLHLRAQLKSGWSVRTATARSPTNSKGQNGTISEAEQEHIRQVLAKAEESKNKEQQRIGKMVDRLEKMRRRATGNGVTHCLLCHTEFGLLASKSYAAMCVDCRKYVCQRNCGVETMDPSRGEMVFLCKICSEAREVLWKKSGAWFYKEMPEFQRPDIFAQLAQQSAQVHQHGTPSGGAGTPYANGGASTSSGGIAAAATAAASTATRPQPSWAQAASPGGQMMNGTAGVCSTTSPVPNGVRRGTGEMPSTSRASICSMLQAVDPLERSKSPRPRIQPSWVKEKVMSSMSVDDEERAASSSDGEGFAQSGVIRKTHHRATATKSQNSRREANLARFAINSQRIYDSEDDSSPESRPSTRSTSPRHSLATPSSYDATNTHDPQHDDARSIDSGVVQSDHSNPQQGGLTFSTSSLTPQQQQQQVLQQVLQQQVPQQQIPQEPLASSSTFGLDRHQSDHKMSSASSLSSSGTRRIGAGLDGKTLMTSSSSLSTAQAACQMGGTGLQNGGQRAESPAAASFMSSPDDDTKLHYQLRRRPASGGSVNVPRINSLQLRQSLDDVPPISAQPMTTASSAPKIGGGGEEKLAPSASTSTTMVVEEEDETITKAEPGTLGSIQFDITYYAVDKKLVINLIRAKNLKAMDSNGFSDPYVKLHLIPGNAKATKMTSKTIEKTLNPEWNEELVYYGVTDEDKTKKSLRITVLDRDRIGSDFLGETRIALRKLPNNATKKYNLYLEHAIPVPKESEENNDRGKINVGLQYNIQQGSLFISINRCVELVGMDSTGFSDPYCKVSLTPVTSKAHRQRTSIKKRTLNPEFGETIQFVVPFKDLPKKTLQIGVYDHDLGKQDDYIGGILLSASAKEERGRQWIKCIENPGTLVEAWHKLELDS